MKIQHKNIPYILIASTLGVIALVIIQIIWMRHSWRLSEEIFNQRVTSALCSTIKSYKDGAYCNDGKCAVVDMSGETLISNISELPHDIVNTKDFRETLDKNLANYQVFLPYQISLSNNSFCATDVFQTAISFKNHHGNESYLRVTFPTKERYILGGMTFMVLATLFIVGFITVVLLMVNWSLMKQKLLLQTNVDFFNNMAHEFRTPLSSIGLAVNRLTKKHEDLRENPFLAVIKRENTQLLQEVERVLHLAKIENGEYILEKEKLSIESLIRASIDSLSMSISETNAQILLEGFSTDMCVIGDRQHLVNTFRNLIENALKYNENTPEIHISAKLLSQDIVISFEDNGIGIPVGQRSLIFEKFQRVHQTTHAFKGFGLGLAYVKNMLELHKGNIQVKSEDKKGSCFEVYLPLSV